MQPITVYGIETPSYSMLCVTFCNIACSLLPFTVLKRRLCRDQRGQVRDCMQPITVYGIETTSRECPLSANRDCMQPITVYGIETRRASRQMCTRLDIACSLLPFTVLKRAGYRARQQYSDNCMQPITVYGIETY